MTYNKLKEKQKVIVDKYNRSTNKKNKHLLYQQIMEIENQLEK